MTALLVKTGRVVSDEQWLSPALEQPRRNEVIVSTRNIKEIDRRVVTVTPWEIEAARREFGLRIVNGHIKWPNFIARRTKPAQELSAVVEITTSISDDDLRHECRNAGLELSDLDTLFSCTENCPNILADGKRVFSIAQHYAVAGYKGYPFVWRDSVGVLTMNLWYLDKVWPEGSRFVTRAIQ